MEPEYDDDGHGNRSYSSLLVFSSEDEQSSDSSDDGFEQSGKYSYSKGNRGKRQQSSILEEEGQDNEKTFQAKNSSQQWKTINTGHSSFASSSSSSSSNTDGDTDFTATDSDRGMVRKYSRNAMKSSSTSLAPSCNRFDLLAEDDQTEDQSINESTTEQVNGKTRLLGKGDNSKSNVNIKSKTSLRTDRSKTSLTKGQSKQEKSSTTVSNSKMMKELMISLDWNQWRAQHLDFLWNRKANGNALRFLPLVLDELEECFCWPTTTATSNEKDTNSNSIASSVRPGHLRLDINKACTTGNDLIANDSPYLRQLLLGSSSDEKTYTKASTDSPSSSTDTDDDDAMDYALDSFEVNFRMPFARFIREHFESAELDLTPVFDWLISQVLLSPCPQASLSIAQHSASLTRMPVIDVAYWKAFLLDTFVRTFPIHTVQYFFGSLSSSSSSSASSNNYHLCLLWMLRMSFEEEPSVACQAIQVILRRLNQSLSQHLNASSPKEGKSITETFPALLAQPNACSLLYELSEEAVLAERSILLALQLTCLSALKEISSVQHQLTQRHSLDDSAAKEQSKSHSLSRSSSVALLSALSEWLEQCVFEQFARQLVDPASCRAILPVLPSVLMLSSKDGNSSLNSPSSSRLQLCTEYLVAMASSCPNDFYSLWIPLISTSNSSSLVNTASSTLKSPETNTPVKTAKAILSSTHNNGFSLPICMHILEALLAEECVPATDDELHRLKQALLLAVSSLSACSSDQPTQQLQQQQVTQRDETTDRRDNPVTSNNSCDTNKINCNKKNHSKSSINLKNTASSSAAASSPANNTLITASKVEELITRLSQVMAAAKASSSSRDSHSNKKQKGKDSPSPSIMKSTPQSASATGSSKKTGSHAKQTASPSTSVKSSPSTTSLGSVIKRTATAGQKKGQSHGKDKNSKHQYTHHHHRKGHHRSSSVFVRVSCVLLLLLLGLAVAWLLLGLVNEDTFGPHYRHHAIRLMSHRQALLNSHLLTTLMQHLPWHPSSPHNHHYVRAKSKALVHWDRLGKQLSQRMAPLGRQLGTSLIRWIQGVRDLIPWQQRA